MKDKNNNQINSVTKYGEQVPTLFSWILPEEQKKRAEKLEHITEENVKTNKDKKKN